MVEIFYLAPIPAPTSIAVIKPTQHKHQRGLTVPKPISPHKRVLASMYMRYLPE
jgi:hypothetical protein